MRRLLTSALLVPLLLSVASCGSDAGDTNGPVAPPLPPGAPVSATPSTGSSPGSSSSAEPALKDDLATGKLRHVIKSSGLTLTVDYETRKPEVPWTATGDKPLRVEVRVTRPTKKVYLTRASLRFSTDDGTGDVPGPDPITDPATNINPGYLVARPYSYVQSFAVPVVDPSSVSMTIDVKLELVSLVDSKSKDYTKQTVTDTVRTSLSS